MIVACEKCSTEFQLDDSKVPAKGIRVRCSRCKHTFRVSQPSEEPREDDVTGPTVRVAPPPLDSEDGDEWQFNDDPPPGGAAAGAVSDLQAFGAVAGLVGSSSEPTPELASEDEGSSPDEVAAALADLLAGGNAASDDSLSAGAHEAEPVSVEDERSTEDLFGGRDSNVGVGACEEESRASAHADQAPDADPGLGSPERWDFFEGSQAKPQQAIGALQIAKVSAAQVAREKLQKEPRVAVRAEPSVVTAWLGRTANGIGWVITLGLVAATAWRVMAGPVAAADEPISSQRIGEIQAESIRGHWLENIEGRIYVISGTLRNAGTGSAGGVGLAVSLLDSGGHVLEVAPAAVGPAIDPQRLREIGPRELQTAQRNGALAWAHSPMAQGERRDFHAVFVSPPDTATQFRLVELAAAAAKSASPSS